MTDSPTKRFLLVTGMSGAGKSTALKTLEDLGWEMIDNFPIRLLENLLKTPPSTSRSYDDHPLAIGFDSRTRGFEPKKLIEQIKKLQKNQNFTISTLFLDCKGGELERRYTETRRRHPLALDRPASDGIALERALLEPLRRWADHLIDTTSLSANALQQLTREKFALEDIKTTTVTITSFGFSRGLPTNIDLLFDVRFLSNPYWEPSLRELTGLDEPVAEYIAKDSAYSEALDKFTDMLEFLLPRYIAAGKAYVNIAIGCTGGRHRSVHVAEALSNRLQTSGFSPNVQHRNLASRPLGALESMSGIPRRKIIKNEAISEK